MYQGTTINLKIHSQKKNYTKLHTYADIKHSEIYRVEYNSGRWYKVGDIISLAEEFVGTHDICY